MPSEETTGKTPVSSPWTGSWENYSSQAYGYQLKYPSDWVVINEANNLGESTMIGMPESATQFVQDGKIAVVVARIGETTLDEYMAQENPSTGGKNSEVYKFQRVTKIDGNHAIITYGGCCGTVGNTVFVKHEDKLYQFLMPENGDQLTGTIENGSTFDMILRSVEFTD